MIKYFSRLPWLVAGAAAAAAVPDEGDGRREGKLRREEQRGRSEDRGQTSGRYDTEGGTRNRAHKR